MSKSQNRSEEIVNIGNLKARMSVSQTWLLRQHGSTIARTGTVRSANRSRTMRVGAMATALLMESDWGDTINGVGGGHRRAGTT